MNDLEKRFSKMTVGELAKIGSKSLGDIVLYALTKIFEDDRKPAPKTQKSASAKVDVSTPAGRYAYDAAILSALRNASGPMSSTDLRAIVGGTAHQLRSRLNLMIEAGTVTYEGRARSTKYEIAQ